MIQENTHSLTAGMQGILCMPLHNVDMHASMGGSSIQASADEWDVMQAEWIWEM